MSDREPPPDATFADAMVARRGGAPPPASRPRDGRIDWWAAALELLPLLAIPITIVTVFEPDLFWAFLPVSGVSMASGLGWWKIGLPRIGCLVAIVRGVVIPVLFWIAFFVSLVLIFRCWGEEDCTNAPEWVVVASLLAVAVLGLAGLVSPIVSAVLVARASRRV